METVLRVENAEGNAPLLSDARNPRRRHPPPITHGNARPPRAAKGNRAPGAARSRAQPAAATTATVLGNANCGRRARRGRRGRDVARSEHGGTLSAV